MITTPQAHADSPNRPMLNIPFGSSMPNRHGALAPSILCGSSRVTTGCKNFQEPIRTRRERQNLPHPYGGPWLDQTIIQAGDERMFRGLRLIGGQQRPGS